MVIADEARDGTTRYRLLETLRQYARDRLDDTGDADAWRRRHAEHYAAFAEAGGAGLARPRRARVATARRDRARQPARPRWPGASTRDDADDRELALRIVAGLWPTRPTRDAASKSRAWAERALPCRRAIDPRARGRRCSAPRRGTRSSPATSSRARDARGRRAPRGRSWASSQRHRVRAARLHRRDPATTTTA